MDIDAIIAEATPEVANEQIAPVNEASEPETTTESEVDSQQEEVESEDIGSKPDSELTPEQLAKREWNRKSHMNSKLARQARELRELRELKAKLEQPQAKTQEPQAPNMDNFDTLEEYMDARDAYRDKLSAQTKNEPQIAQGLSQAVAKEVEFAKNTPDYEKLIGENADFFDEVGRDAKLQTAIIEADNAPLALYALMKEGLIGELYDLTPTRLAAELAKAEIRGQSYLVQKRTTTNAPAPITSAKGKGITPSSIDKLDGASLLKSIRQTT